MSAIASYHQFLVCVVQKMSCVLLSFLKLTKSSKVFKQNWNDVATLLFHKFTTHDETYLRRLLEGPLHMEITLIPDLHTISLNKICNKYSIYNCYLGIYKQRKCQMRKKEKIHLKKSHYQAMNSNGNMKTFQLIHVFVSISCNECVL